MVDHLHAFAPEHAARVGPEAIERVVQMGMEKCHEHGFDLRGPVRLYLEMMLLLGSHFDTDPQFGWAAEILAASSQDVMLRARHLFTETEAYLSAVYGPENAYSVRALDALSERLGTGFGPFHGRLEDALLSELSACYPERYAYVGEARLRRLAQRAIEHARDFSFTRQRGQILVFVLMVAFGHGFADDPLFPWISEENVLGISNPDARADRLEKRMRTYMAAVVRKCKRA
jgi:hypothetical protein